MAQSIMPTHADERYAREHGIDKEFSFTSFFPSLSSAPRGKRTSIRTPSALVQLSPQRAV